MVKKKEEGKYRMVCDFRKLNADTVKDKYPVPRIDDTIDALYGAKYFTTLDLFSGFWQVTLDEESKCVMSCCIKGRGRPVRLRSNNRQTSAATRGADDSSGGQVHKI
jgi:Reverse transcriptase (RNA-dependent DNA polymerase)